MTGLLRKRARGCTQKWHPSSNSARKLTRGLPTSGLPESLSSLVNRLSSLPDNEDSGVLGGFPLHGPPGGEEGEEGKMKTIATLMMLAILAIAVACTSADTTSTTVGGVSQPPVTHSHNYLEY